MQFGMNCSIPVGRVAILDYDNDNDNDNDALISLFGSFGGRFLFSLMRGALPSGDH